MSVDLSDKNLVFYQTLVLTIDKRYGDDPVTVPTVCVKEGESYWALNPMFYDMICVYLNEHECPAFFFKHFCMELKKSELSKLTVWNLICYVDEECESDDESDESEQSEESLVETIITCETNVPETCEQSTQVDISEISNGMNSPDVKISDEKNIVEISNGTKISDGMKKSKRRRRRKNKKRPATAPVVKENVHDDGDIYKCLYETLRVKVKKVLMSSFSQKCTKKERRRLLANTFDRMKRYRYFKDMKEEYSTLKKIVDPRLNKVSYDEGTMIKLFQSSLGHGGYIRRTLNIIPVVMQTNAYIQGATGLDFNSVECPQQQIKMLLNDDPALNKFSRHLKYLKINPEMFMLHYSLIVQSLMDITFEKFTVLHNSYKQFIVSFRKINNNVMSFS